MVDQVNVGDEPSADDKKAREDHDAAMIKRAEEEAAAHSPDGKSGEEGDANERAQRPDDIPEKFWDAEKGEVNVPALLKAQADAEAALRKAQTPPNKEGEDGDKGGEGSRQNAVNAASAEYAEKGELSPETYESLEKEGLSKEMVDNHIEGQKAIIGSLQTAAFGEFDGSQENYQKATEWAAENLSEDEIEALDVQLTSRNPTIVAQGAKALAEKYAAEADIEPGRTVTGGGNTPDTGSYFKSSSEMQAAMNDPRYRKDDSFRKEVIQKIARADKAGVNLFG